MMEDFDQPMKLHVSGRIKTKVRIVDLIPHSMTAYDIHDNPYHQTVFWNPEGIGCKHKLEYNKTGKPTKISGDIPF